MTTNEKIINWIAERLTIQSRAGIDWTQDTEDFVASGPHGNDNPPDVLPMEVAMRLAECGDTYVVK
ncbi:MAG TPA: hypothetical protein VM243_06415 [Phycisphaerae bacterium]|nr:hypothetical protein [Phycisphaerae bacterium]